MFVNPAWEVILGYYYTMSQFLTGSICLDDIQAALKAKHSCFSKGNNGKIYIAIKQWLNDEPDQFGNHASVLLNSKKDAPAEESAKKIYIGNLKIQSTGGEAVKPEEADTVAADLQKAVDGLPF